MTPTSEGRRYHEANAGRDSKPVIFIFEGNNILWMLLGCGLALLVFRLGHDPLNWSIGESLAAGLVPLSIISLYVVLLKSGKPQSFDREFFEWMAVRSRQALDHFGLMRDRAYFAPPKSKPARRPNQSSSKSSSPNNHGQTD